MRTAAVGLIVQRNAILEAGGTLLMIVRARTS